MQQNIIETVTTLLDRAVIVPKLLGVVALLILGWLIAVILRKAVVKVLKLIKLDVISEKSGLASILVKGEIKYTLSELVGAIVYWLLMLIVFIAAINAFGLTIAAQLLDKIVLYIPNVIAAIFVLVIGMFVAAFLAALTSTSASNAGLRQAHLLGQLVRVIVIVFVAVAALEQLGIATNIISTAVSVILGAIGLSFAIAFGLGAKDIAGKIISEWLEKLKK